MASNEPKSKQRATTPPSQYSEKLQSLLDFLDEHDGAADDNVRGGPGPPPSATRRVSACGGGLADITNRGQSTADERASLAGEKEEALKDIGDHIDANVRPRGSSKNHMMRDKKYIWDDWPETGDGGMIFLQEESSAPAGRGVPKSSENGDSIENTVPDNAHEQLRELKLMSLELSTRATAMKIEMEQKRREVEELHSIRVKNESAHVERMKSVKQEWKKRVEVATAECDRITSEQKTRRTELQDACDALERELANIEVAIEKTRMSEQEMCDRLRRDGERDLEESRINWQNAERAELKKKDLKLSPKLKKEAAKAVEPKLRQLMEQNREEVERLEREAARELDLYKLELYRKSNAEFKKETNQLRADERKRHEKLEAEWMSKLEASRAEHESEMKSLRKRHEQRLDLMKQQFNLEKEKRIHEHEALCKEARANETRQMEQLRAKHERDLLAMENAHSESNHKSSCEQEFKRWQAQRGAQLMSEEESTLKEEFSKLESKVQSEIQLVKKKLAEEQRAKRQLLSIDASNRKAAKKKQQDKDLRRLEEKSNSLAKKHGRLKQREGEALCLRKELQSELKRLEMTVHEREQELATQERRHIQGAEVNDQKLDVIRQDGERRVRHETAENEALDKSLQHLIADTDSKTAGFGKELGDLRADNADEQSLARDKVRVMVENKKSALQNETAKLYSLRQVTANIEKQLDDARMAKVLGTNGSTTRKNKK